MLLDDSNIKDYLRNSTEIRNEEKNTIFFKESSWFCLSYGGFGEFQKFCIIKSIPFKIYERYDGGGGCGFIFQVKELDHKKELISHFKLREDQIFNFSILGLGYAYNLISTNCTEQFKIPTKKVFYPSIVFMNLPDRALFDDYPFIVRKLKNTVYQVIPIDISDQLDEFEEYGFYGDYFCLWSDNPYNDKMVLNDNTIELITYWLEESAKENNHEYCLVVNNKSCIYISKDRTYKSDEPPSGGIVLLPNDELLPEGITEQIRDFELQHVVVYEQNKNDRKNSISQQKAKVLEKWDELIQEIDNYKNYAKNFGGTIGYQINDFKTRQVNLRKSFDKKFYK